ncbi:unnamed protein product [Auanema sp. JU1783]|nr:unnamed protein product [Auanema sp. JU1783]
MAELDILRVKQDRIQDPALTAEWNKKALVWVPHEKDGFVLASVVKDDNSDLIEVEILDTNEKQRISRDDCQKVNPPRFDKCEDMANMSCLNEASVLCNLKQRYYANLIYTYSGLFCVVINPYQRLPIYTDSIADLFKGKKRKEMPPHIFAATDEAYRNMLQDKEDQSILCTGESGAGKTENTKKVIQYLANVAGSRKTGIADLDTSHTRLVGHLEEQLLQANPILEAFGNSKTIKNDNSSRFGKFIRVHFDATGCISGANIEFYLLEKSRVLRQAVLERSFHIFYQMLKGATPKMKSDLLLEENIGNYRFLSNADVHIPGVDDKTEFAETVKAMNIMGIEENEVQDILRIVSAVLLFGNLEFGHENKNSDQAILLNDAVAQKICTLLGLNLSDLMRAFLKPKIKVQRDHVHRSQSEEQARFSVEAIAKACFERLFRWLVQRLNKSLDRTRQNAISFVGILDIAGFEIFDMNSFEQLCINYTNEKLQQLFNNTMFIREQQEYLDEGLDWDMIDFGLNLQPTIDLIEKPMGILSTLDDVCLFPQGSDTGFVERLVNQHHQHPKYVVPEMRAKSDFAVVHYAGRVDYAASGWRVKNMDPLNENVVELLQSARESLLAEIWKDVSDVCSMGATEVGDAAIFGARVKKGMFRTVSQMHKEQLTRLMSTLHNTNPHFVRCIIPNHEKKPGSLNANLVLDQLRCNGVLEGIRICRQGFPNRLPFQEFRQRYERLLTPEAVPHGFMDGKEAVRLMMTALELQPTLFRIGQSKIFFRTGVLAELERLRDERLTELVIQFQAVSRGVLARKQFSRRKEQAAAIRLIQRNGLAWMRLREWQWWRLYTKVKPLLEVTNKDELIAEKEIALKTTNEKLRRSELFISDMSDRLSKMEEERARIQQKLDIETLERAEADEARAHVSAKKAELEEAMMALEKQLKSEEQGRSSAEVERKRLIETVHDLEMQLEEEEKKRQTIQLEKNSLQNSLKQYESVKHDLEENSGKVLKEKLVLEARCKDLSDRLIDEEEKVKSLTKLKTRFEAQIAELAEECDREKSARASVESAKRALDNELRDERETSSERLRKAEELTQQLLKKESELAASVLKSDEEAAQIQQMERDLRDLRAQMDDLQEDIKQEQAARVKAEKARRNMSEELEAYKLELEESLDKSVLHQEMRNKREEEFVQLQKQLEESMKDSTERVETVRSKYQKQVDELTENIDLLKRQKLLAEKSHGQVEGELQSLQAEVETLLLAKQEADRRRKNAESQLSDQQLRFKNLQEEADDITSKLAKANIEIESLHKLKDADSENNASLLKRIATLETQVSEYADAEQESQNNRNIMMSRMRSAEDGLAEAKEQNDDLLEKIERQDREITALRTQLAEAKRKLEDETGEKIEEVKRKLGKDLADAIARGRESDALREKAEKAKKKALEEAEDLSRELAEVGNQLRDLDRRQRKFDQQLAEEKANTTKVQQALDLAQEQMRDSETKKMNTQKEMEELKEQLAEVEKERRMLKLEVDNLASNQDDTGKNVYELEKAKTRLEDELSRARELIIELEDATQLAEDAKSRIEVQFQAAKQEWARTAASREEEEEERRRTLVKQVRDLTEELETERRFKATALASKKKSDTQLQTLQEENEKAMRQLDELTRQCRRANQNAKDAQIEGSEARAAMDEALCTSREAEKRVRHLEGEITRLGDELNLATQGRKKAEAERDDLLDEVRAVKNGQLGQEEKRRFERRIADLEDQLDEEQTSHEVTAEKMKQAQTQVEKLTTELTQERAMCERMESDKKNLERNVRDLNQQLENVEGSVSARMRAQIANYEARNRQITDQLDETERDRASLVRQIRRLDRQLAEMNEVREEERRHAQQDKESADSASARLRHAKRELNDREDELEKEKIKLKEARRQVDDLAEQIQTLTRENQSFKSRVTADRRSVMALSRDSRRYGSSHSIRGSTYFKSMNDPQELEFADDSRPLGDDVRPSSRLTTGSHCGPSEDDRESNKT